MQEIRLMGLLFTFISIKTEKYTFNIPMSEKHDNTMNTHKDMTGQDIEILNLFFNNSVVDNWLWIIKDRSEQA